VARHTIRAADRSRAAGVAVQQANPAKGVASTGLRSSARRRSPIILDTSGVAGPMS
jgi:hypothetical protein